MTRHSVSVIIPAYRAKDTIRRAIDSVLAQTVPVGEILVVDDGSPDDLGSVTGGYGPRVRLVRQPNRGAASARNLGIERSTGDLIAFLDADDYWEPMKLERQVNVFTTRPEVGVVGCRGFVEHPGRPRSLQPTKSRAPFDRVINATGRQAFDISYHLVTSALIVRRDALGSGRFVTGLEPAEDRDLFFRLAESSPIYILSEPLMTSVQEPSSLSRAKPDRNYRSMLRVLDRHRNRLGLAGFLLWRSWIYFEWGISLARPSSALVKLLQSFLYWPLPFEKSRTGVRFLRLRSLTVRVLLLAGLYPGSRRHIATRRT